MILGEVVATVAAFEANAMKMVLEAEEMGDLEIKATSREEEVMVTEDEVKMAELVGPIVGVPVEGVKALRRRTRETDPRLAIVPSF